MNNNETKISIKESSLLKEKIYEIHHKSGLKIYVAPKKLSTSYAIFGTKYGSIDSKFKLSTETQFTTVPDGIAHFLEHKLFTNEDGSDATADLAKFGANGNAYTSNTMTAYLFSCTENFYDSLKVLLNFVMTPFFTEESVEKEQGIIGQEIRMYEDNPKFRAYYSLLNALYHNHNIKIDICGTVESIAQITPEILYQCHKTFYNLHNMTLVVSGDLDVDEVIRVADEVLKPAQQQTIELYTIEEPAHVAQKRAISYMQVSKPMVQIGIKDTNIISNPKVRIKREIALNVLYQALFGKTDEFYYSLYEDGIVAGPYSAGYSTGRSFAYGSIYAETDKPEELYNRFIKKVEEAKINGVPKDSFERCKRVMYADYIRTFDSTDDIANTLISFDFEDCDMFEFAELINEVTYEEVNQYLHEYFKEEYYALSAIMPLDAK